MGRNYSYSKLVTRYNKPRKKHNRKMKFIPL